MTGGESDLSDWSEVNSEKWDQITRKIATETIFSSRQAEQITEGLKINGASADKYGNRLYVRVSATNSLKAALVVSGQLLLEYLNLDLDSDFQSIRGIEQLAEIDNDSAKRISKITNKYPVTLKDCADILEIIAPLCALKTSGGAKKTLQGFVEFLTR